MFKRILVPIDGSTRSNRAVKVAADLARRYGGSLTLFYAVPAFHPPFAMEGYALDWPTEPEYRKATAKSTARVLERARKLAPRVKVAMTHAFSDAPASAILAEARKARADAIVMTSHGRTGLERLLLGSQAQKVLAHAKLPVVVVR